MKLKDKLTKIGAGIAVTLTVAGATAGIFYQCGEDEEAPPIEEEAPDAGDVVPDEGEAEPEAPAPAPEEPEPAEDSPAE